MSRVIEAEMKTPSIEQKWIEATTIPRIFDVDISEAWIKMVGYVIPYDSPAQALAAINAFICLGDETNKIPLISRESKAMYWKTQI